MSFPRKLSVILLSCLAFSISVRPQEIQTNQPKTINTQLLGTITDRSGAPVSNARVTVYDGTSTESVTRTNIDGGFVVFTSLRKGELRVEAEGFAVKRLAWSNTTHSQFEIVLDVAPVTATVTITPTRTETALDETAASVSIISRAELSVTAASRMDDALRQVPGFSLFRRTGSRAANPTTQGVSLRGVGASGASRGVVLLDGLSLNDPFGGWVYWSRIPRESVSQVEVLRGGASSVYGSSALGGVINLISNRREQSFFSLESSYGAQQTTSTSVSAGLAKKRWSAIISSELFTTKGYILIDSLERGPVDTRAGSRSLVNDLTISRRINSVSHVFLRGAVFGESRTNGTPLQINRTHIRNLSIGADFDSRSLGSARLRAFGSSQVYDQTFTAVTTNRTGESLTRVQRVPAQSIGFSAQWSRAIGMKHTLVAGLEGREVRGASDEIAYVQGQQSTLIGSGGKERTMGVFGEDIFRISSQLILTGGIRVDRWREFDAHSTTRGLRPPASPVTQIFANRTEVAASPQMSVLFRPTETVSLAASFTRAFRQPTLNELYRSFRVGDVLTLANEKLLAERLTGGETSATFHLLGGKLLTRSTLFWSAMTRPVANVTLSTTPTLITRQRRNLGRTRSRGLELEVESQLRRNLVVSGTYVFAGARVLEFPANTTLEGLIIPQIARHQFTLQARYTTKKNAFGLQGRGAGNQFDDDQNVFRLGRYATFDAFVSRRLNHNFEIFAAAENLFDQHYTVGRTPISTIGSPRLVRAGFRIRVGKQ